MRVVDEEKEDHDAEARSKWQFAPYYWAESFLLFFFFLFSFKKKEKRYTDDCDDTVVVDGVFCRFFSSDV